MFSSFRKFSPTDSDNSDNEISETPSYTPPTPPVSPWEPESGSTAAPTLSSHTPLASGIQRAQPTRNVLNSDVEVIGTLKFQDDLLIDGVVEGKIFSDGTLTIGQNARIQAEIRTKSVIIHGKVIGNITVVDKVELKSTAELVGDIQASSFAVESGAIFIGHSTVGAPSTEIPSSHTKKEITQPSLPVVDNIEENNEPEILSTTEEMEF